MPRTFIRPLTYAPKIPGVLDGTIRQAIRVGQKLAAGDRILFHGWAGTPYRSKWSFRTPYFTLIAVIPIPAWCPKRQTGSAHAGSTIRRGI